MRVGLALRMGEGPWHELLPRGREGRRRLLSVSQRLQEEFKLFLTWIGQQALPKMLPTKLDPHVKAEMGLSVRVEIIAVR